MPPFKPPGLKIVTETDVMLATGGGAGSLKDSEASWDVKADGNVCMLGKSMKGTYVFGEQGLISAAGTQAPHYKVSEKDIMFIKQLGAGACATVYKGYLMDMRKFVAVKRVNVTNREQRQQMLRDIKILSDAQAVPGLLSFLGAYLVPKKEQMAIVLEYMDGGTLADVLSKLGRLPEDVLANITGKLLRGLAFMHAKRMVHRDIKPANILMSLSGEAKLSDFGISATVEHTFAQCTTFAGTVTYMSPERMVNKPYNFTADMWSLGLVLVECLTGSYPYDATGGPVELMIQVLQGDPPLPPPGTVSELCRDFLAACLQRDPTQRPPASVLLHHPWITQASPVNLKGLLRETMFSRDDKLDEIAFHFSFTYYSLLSQAAAPTAAAAAGLTPGNGLGQLAPLYLDHSMLSHEGVRCSGGPAIMALLQQVVQEYSAGGVPAAAGSIWKVTSVDCQDVLGTVCLIVMVTGSIQLPSGGGSSGSGGSGNTAGSSGTAAPATAAFAESFVLNKTELGEYYVANQVFRLFK